MNYYDEIKNKLIYYINITINNNLSKRGLREKIKNKEYVIFVKIC